MNPRATRFTFDSYEFMPEQKQVLFRYRQEFEDQPDLVFTETVQLPDQEIDTTVPPELLTRVLEGLHLILGISYYKAYCPSEVEIPYQLTEQQAQYWSTVYRRGLGEFLYRQQLDPSRVARFPATPGLTSKPFDLPRSNKVLVGIGGGKDSVVAGELLKSAEENITAFVVETQRPFPIVDEVIQVMDVPRLSMRRLLDPQIFRPLPGSFNGHVPFSAIVAWLGVLAAVLYDYRYIVVSNERSSNVGNIDYHGETVNHQWSKSTEFEELMQEYLRHVLTPDITYTSLLRPFAELRVVELFTRYQQYWLAFSSCNRNFTSYKARGEQRWCGECDKCAFTFAMLAAYLTPQELIPIFTKNLFDDEKLLPTYRNLLGLGDLKPFECVGTFEETQVAFQMAQEEWGKTRALSEFLPKLTNTKETAQEVLATAPAANVPHQWRFLGVKNTLILGYGREGKVSEEYVKKHHPDVSVGTADQATDGEAYLEKQYAYDISVKTPGIPKELVKTHYTTATNLFFAQVPNLIIGVTGSKGKSTTSSLLAHILKTAGKPVELLGNIGRPMLACLAETIDPEAIFVLELSSFQLDDIAYSPAIAVVTNLFPEHMDYHQAIEAYYQAKRNIVRWQRPRDLFVYNPEVVLLNEWAAEATSKSVPFDRELPLPTEDIPLLGAHNHQNVRAATTVARQLGIADDVIAEAIRTFKALPHRLEPVGEYKGIRFFDDAISTTPESTIAALNAVPHVATIFLGGEDRGYDFAELEKALREKDVRNIVLFPDSGARILASREGFTILETKSMAEAVKFAYEHTPTGSVCLLSCASPSYSLWRDFEVKGDEFQAEVKRQGK